MSFLNKFAPQNSSTVLYSSDSSNKNFFSIFKKSYVSSLSAQQITNVFTCVNLKANALAVMPLILYIRTTNGKAEAIDHNLYNLLKYEPNPDLTAFEWKKMISQDFDLRGDHFAQIIKNGLGEITAIYPLRADLMDVTITSYREKIYRYDGKIVPSSRILHLIDIPDTSKYGLVGISKIAYNQQTFEFAQNTSNHGNQIFKNGATPSGAFENPTELSQEAYNRLKEDLEDRYTGLENSGKPLLLEGGLKFTPLKITNSDSQWLESRKYNREEIGNIFGVPAAMLNDSANTAYNNLEQKSLDFQTTTMFSITTATEQKMRQKLLTEDEKKDYLLKFKFNALMRVDAKTRAEYFKTRFNTGSISPNEIREHEDENGYEGGDNYYMQLNMATVKNINKGEENE